MAEPIVKSLISSAGDCTVKTYIKCKFDKDLSVLVLSGNHSEQELIEAFENINAEFLDLSGTEIAEINLMEDVHKLSCRVESAKAFFSLQHIWLQYFEQPPEPALIAMDELRQYGYKLSWNGDKEEFKSNLVKCELKEKKKHVQLIEKQKELEAFNKAEQQAETNPAIKKTIRNSRTEFVKVLTELQRFGYPINRDTTYMDELGIMYKEYKDYCSEANAKN